MRTTIVTIATRAETKQAQRMFRAPLKFRLLRNPQDPQVKIFLPPSLLFRTPHPRRSEKLTLIMTEKWGFADRDMKTSSIEVGNDA